MPWSFFNRLPSNSSSYFLYIKNICCFFQLAKPLCTRMRKCSMSQFWRTQSKIWLLSNPYEHIGEDDCQILAERRMGTQSSIHWLISFSFFSSLASILNKLLFLMIEYSLMKSMTTWKINICLSILLHWGWTGNTCLCEGPPITREKGVQIGVTSSLNAFCLSQRI